MIKLGNMLVKHKAESMNWKGPIGLKIEEKVQINIVKGEILSVSPFLNGVFGFFFFYWKSILKYQHHQQNLHL